MKLQRYSVNYAIFSILMDALAVLASLTLTIYLRQWMNRFAFILPMEIPTRLPVYIYVLFPLIWVIVLSTFSLYNASKYVRAVDEFSALTAGAFLASLCQAGLIYLTARDISRAYFLTATLLAFLLCLMWRAVARLIFRTGNAGNPNLRRIVVAGSDITSENRKWIRRLEQEYAGDLEFICALQPEEGENLTSPAFMERVRQVLCERKATDLMLAVKPADYPNLSPLIESLDDLALSIRLTLNFSELALFGARVETFAGTPTLDLRAPALSEFDRILKRSFDLLAGTLLFVLSLPLILVSSLLILLDDGWPVIYKQTRIGERGRPFTMYKLRTMVRSADRIPNPRQYATAQGEQVYKTRDDPRITRVGKFLRRFSLDELPQFFNVLIGDMSLVGPRPEMPDLVNQYERWQLKRQAVPPGVTGWWQVTGRSDKAMHLHTEDDLYYVENYSIWLDLQILIRTVWVVLVGKGSY